MNESALPSKDSLCPRCGLKKGQIGSVTYWIFKDGRCQCEMTASGAQSDKNAQGPGRQILNDRYELVQSVGQGATGFVYKGKDLATGQVVALKLMRPELAQNESAIRRLKKEVAAVSSLSHSNLGQVHGYGQEKDGLPYLVMEFVEGENLANIIHAEGKLAPPRALDLFMQICSGLSCAHANGLIHRDLKPGNVIVQKKENGQERAAIVDFGFARMLADSTDSVRLTQEGEAFGSPAYMSPEQCLGQELDIRSDIYSLGCLMYEALTGVPPLLGENVLATVAKQVREHPKSVRERIPTIAEEFDAIVMKCLNKEAVLRYQSATDLRHDLDGVRQGSFTRSRAKVVRKHDKGEGGGSLRSLEASQQRRAVLIGIIALTAIIVGTASAACVWLLMRPNTSAANAVAEPGNLPAAPTHPMPARAAAVESQPEAPARPNLPPHVQPSQRPPAHTASGPAKKPANATISQPKKSDSPSSWDQLKELRVYK